MDQLNFLALEGNLTEDPDFRATTTGKSVVRLRIANNRSYKKGEGYQKDVLYFNVEAWGDLAIACRDHLKKGREIRALGKLVDDSYERDGKKHTGFKLAASEIDFGDKPKAD